MTDLVARVQEALARLPSATGGDAIVLATSGPPPAMALLSTGDVHIVDGEVLVGIHASSSAVSRLGGSFTLLIPLGEIAARIEVASASASTHGPLALLSGEIASIRPTTEPPWVLEMRFRPEHSGHPAIPQHLRYWVGVRDWLAGGSPHPPAPPF